MSSKSHGGGGGGGGGGAQGTAEQQNGLLQPLVDKEQGREESVRGRESEGAGGVGGGGEAKELTDRSDQSLLSLRRRGETSSSTRTTAKGCFGRCTKFFSKIGQNCERAWLVSLFALPEAVSSFLMKTVYGKRVSAEGKDLDTKMQILLEVTRTFQYDLVAVMEKNVNKSRRLFEKIFRAPLHRKVRMREISIPCGEDHHEVSARIYTPEELVAAESDIAACPIPVLVYYHGGGWVLGNVNSHEGMLSQIAHWSKCAVVSVDYRLAPEHPYPAAVHDALSSFQWVAENAAQYGWDERKIAVGGDSAGGNLAAIVCQQAVLKDFNIKPTLQVLLFPALYLGNEPKDAFKSVWEFGPDPFYLLSLRDMAFFRNAYVGSKDGMDLTQSPILAEGKLLEQLPPAYFFLCHFDVLRDEGREYAKRLDKNGVRAVVEEFNAHHAFIYHFRRVKFAREGLKRIATFMRSHMYPSKL